MLAKMLLPGAGKYTLLLILLILGSSCKKTVATISPDLPEISNTDLSGPLYVDNVSLNSINFSPSGDKLTLASTAKGYYFNNDIDAVSLTNSGWTHPSVLYFKEGWNRYKYWMAITPYPNGNNEFENPHIFCSNNGLNWFEPLGISNPIQKSPFKPGYNSDVNLLFDSGKLYCYWRANYQYDSTIKKMPARTLYQCSSSDGVHWSAKKYVTSCTSTKIDIIAPSVIRDEDKYYCYSVSTGEATSGSYYTNNSIRRMTSNTSAGFVADKDKGYNLVKIEGRPWGDKEDPWHLEARKVRNIWFLLVATTITGGSGSPGRLFLGYSKDGVNFTFNNKPICNLTNVYKSSFLVEEDPAHNKMAFKLWRASSTNWTMYYDEFTLNVLYTK